MNGTDIINTNQIQQFGEALLVIIAYVLIGYIMQRVGYLIPDWYSKSEMKRTSQSSSNLYHGNYQQFIQVFKEQYRQLLIFMPIKYVGNFLYYIVLPLQYFQLLSTSLTAYHSIENKNGNNYSNNPFFWQNLIICITAKSFLLILAGLFSTCLYYSRKRKSRQQTGILTNEADVTAYMHKYRQVEYIAILILALCIIIIYIIIYSVYYMIIHWQNGVYLDYLQHQHMI